MRLLRALSAAFVAAIMLAPAAADAGLRGAFDPITNDSKIPNGFEQASFRPVPAVDGVEKFFAFSTRSEVLHYEGSREIWLHVLASRAGFDLTGSELDAVRVPLLRDPSGVTSYIDPAWSPDGRFLAYGVTDRYFSRASLWVQQFRISDLLSEAATPIGFPILVASSADGSHNRHPSWSPDGSALAFESDREGSLDIYTVQVFPSVGTPVNRSADPYHAEQSPSWGPDGTRLVYTSNAIGPDALYILDLNSPLPNAVTRAETRNATTARHNSVWSRDGSAIYYDAAALDQPERVSDIFRLDLATGERCAIFIDDTADWDPDVSHYGHTSPDGIPYEYILFSSMAAPFISRGPNVWRAEYIQTCIPPLPMLVDFQPNSFKLGSSGQDIVATLRFPPQTKAAGYQCQSFNGPLEGVRMRILLLPSPTLLGAPAKGNREEVRLFGDQAVTALYRDYTVGGDPRIDVRWDRSVVESLLVTNGLTDRVVPVPVEAYSNGVGRRFRGLGYMKLSTSSLASGLERGGTGSARMLSASPNPFNPSTTLRFRMGEAGEAVLRVFDTRGTLVRTLLREWLPAGAHEARWDGRDERGGEVASGIYFAQIETGHGPPDRLKLALMK